MNRLIQCKTTILPILIGGVLGCFGLLPQALSVVPPPDGGYPGGNTAEGQSALLNLTSGGYNTAIGFHSLQSNTSAAFNTAIGAGALFANNGYDNTATGALALFLNTTGGGNSATGFEALFKNTTGTNNTAMGLSTLFSNTAGSDNTAVGANALSGNATGGNNTAIGDGALISNTTGGANTAVGVLALSLSTGDFNTAIGYGALSNTTGSFNIALGQNAGSNLTTGDNNIDIGNAGVAGDSNAIRIGNDAHQGATFIAAVYGVAVSGLTVVMDSSDHLGTLGSSRRFKDEIKPMGTVSEAILALKPVTFRYKKEIDSEATPQFGLVAEDVEKVNPDLVVRDKQGKPYSVRYDQVNAMLLNEFLKEHKTVQELKKEIAALTATVKEQAAQIQKVSAHLELSKPAPQTVVNNQ